MRRTTVDHTTGLALVTLDGPALRAARVGTAHEPRPGLPIFLLTCTRDGERKATTGHVSAVGPFEAFWEYMLDRAIMTTAINPGLAGAPLFDLDGRLLGLVSLGLASVGRYSLAIPVRPLPRAARGDGGGRRTPLRPGLGGLLPAGLRRRRHRHRRRGRRSRRPGGGRRAATSCSRSTARPSPRCASCTPRSGARRPGETVGLQILRDSAIRVVEIAAGDRDDFYR